MTTQRAQRIMQGAQKAIAAFALALAVFAFKPTYAQTFPLQIQVSVLPPYSAYLQDYPGTGQRVRVFLINTSRNTYQIRLLGQLTGDNGVEIRTSPNYRPPRPLTVPPGQTLLSRTDLEGLFDLNQIEVTGIDKNLLARGFPLPDGTYQLCVRAFNESATNTAVVAFGQALSPEFPLGCSAPIVVRAVEPPILISPLCDAEVTATTSQAIVFTWTPPVGVSPAQVDYTLRIVELPQVNIDPNVYIDAVALPKSGVEVRNLRTSTFLYGPTQPPLTVGKRYAWRVQAIDRSGKLNFLNDGKAPVCAFTYGSPVKADSVGVEKKKNIVYKSNNFGATCSCKQPPTQGTTVDNKSALEAGKASVAGFPLTFLKTPDGVKETDGVLTGHGTIPMPIVNNANFKLRVELVNVQCNAAGEVISGYVQAIRSGDFPGILPKISKPSVDPPGIPVISTANADSVGSQVQKLSDQMKAFPGHLLSQAGEVAKSVGMEVPFGIDKSFGPISTNIAITDVIFTSEDAYFNATTFIESPGLNAQFQGIPLAAYHVCIKPDGTCGDKILYLAKDMPASSLLTLKGGAVAFKALQNNVTHVVFDETGLKSLHVAAGINTPGLLRKSDSQPLELLTTFDLPTLDFKKWTAQVQTEEEFYVVGLSDFVFSMKDKNGTVQSAIYDHDDDSNPGTIPADYDPGKDPTWHGLYLPRLTISMPFLKSLNNGNDVPFGVENMIYDANGFTGDAIAGDETHPLISLGQGNMASWYCSADQIKLSFRQSGLQSSNLLGKVVLPICKVEDKLAVIPYTCILSKNPKGGGMDFQFVLQPKDKIHAEVWVADLGLDPTSNITISYVGGSFSAKASLDGKISIKAGPLNADLVKFQGLSLMTEAPYFGLTALSTASPEKGLAGLPFSIKTPTGKKPFDYDAQTKLASLNFIGMVNLTGDDAPDSKNNVGLSGSVTAKLLFQIGLKDGRPDWEYKDVDVTQIHVDSKMGALRIVADIDDYENSLDYGDGFHGKADLYLPFANAGFGIEAYFGRMGEGAAAYRYWMVGGKATLPAGGIPIPPTPLAFKGFGGGIFKNMKQTLGPDYTTSYKPENNKFGFEANVMISSTDGSLMQMVGTMSAGFQVTPFKLDTIGLGVDLSLVMLPTGNPLATGHGRIGYSLSDNVFDAKFSLSAGFGDKSIIRVEETNDMTLHIQPGTWYFSLGEPQSPASMKLWALGQNIFTAGSYLMTGNDTHGVTLPPLPSQTVGMSQETLNLLGYSAGPQLTSAFKTNDKENLFLAFGVNYKTGFDYTIGPFFLEMSGGIGYDVKLQKVTEKCAGMSDLPGINGWYANGQIYAYLHFALGIDVDLWIYEGRIKAVELDAAALLQGGLPNPIWFHGDVLLKYNVLHGLVKGNFHMDFWYNKDLQCEPKPAFTPPNPFAEKALIARLGPSTTGEAEPVSILTPMYAEFNYPVETDIFVDGIDNKNQPYSRTFRLRFTDNGQFNHVRKAGAISANFAKCNGDNTGRLRFGKNSDGDDNYSAYFYRNSALVPNSDYTLTVGLQVQVWSGNGSVSPNDKTKGSTGDWIPYLYKDTDPVEQVASVSFKTGNCTIGLSKGADDNSTIAFSFPFEGQRYFMKKSHDGSVAKPFIRLKASLCCMDNVESNADFTLKVRMTPLAGNKLNDKASLKANATFDGNRFTYELPNGLKNQALYLLELYREPTKAFIDKQMAADQSKAKSVAITASNSYFSQVFSKANTPELESVSLNGKAAMPGPQAGSYGVGAGPKADKVNQQAKSLTEEEYLASLKANNINSIVNKNSVKYMDAVNFKVKTGNASKSEEINYSRLYEQSLYSYYFKTSKYDRMKDKLDAATFQPGEQQVSNMGTDNGYHIPIQVEEGFDTYELEGQQVGGGIMLPPMLHYQAAETGAWMDNEVKPFTGKLASYASKFKKEKESATYQEMTTDYFARRLVRKSSLLQSAEKPIDTAAMTLALIFMGLFGQ